jgi:hypothetical protein
MLLMQNAGPYNAGAIPGDVRILPTAYTTTGSSNNGTGYTTAFLYFNIPMYWENAEVFCREQVAGGRLASINSDTDYLAVVNMLNKQTGSVSAWVGYSTL